MRLSSLRRQKTLVDVGPAGYQEFTAGTIPVRGVLSDEEGALVLVEHERGFMRVFDEHLSAVRTGAAPLENVDYSVTWTAITGWEPWPPVIRLELKIDGLNARPRLLFRGETMLPLWLLADGALFGLILRPQKGRVSASSGMWILGPTPARSRPRPDPRRAWRAAADHAGGTWKSARPPRPNGSLSPPPAPNRARAGARAGPPSADEQRKHLRRRRSCVTSPPRPCRET